MIRQIIVISLILSFRLQAQQEPEYHLVHHSGYKHEYVPQRAVYFENAQDTGRLKYIATIELSGPHYNLPVLASWLGLLRIKARELGASMYYLSAYSETPQRTTARFRLYFGPRLLYDQNLKRFQKGLIHILCEFRFANDSNSFFSDHQSHTMSTVDLISIRPANQRYSLISANDAQVTTLKAKLKDGRSAFVVVPMTHGNIRSQYYLSPDGRLLLRSDLLTLRLNKPWELDYQAGRLMLAAWQLSHPF